MCRFIDNKIDTRPRLFLPAQRTLIKPGQFDLKVDFSSLPDQLSSTWVVIVDDVVATGQTASTIALYLKKTYPGIRCALATWLMVEPRQDNSNSGIQGIDYVFADYIVRGNYTRQPPINSLSCLIRNYGKYDSVKKAFIEKYIRNADQFNQVISSIGGVE